LKTIIEKERETPVFLETDVVVAGGGPAGLASAIAAARLGMKVTLVERYGFLGGMATGGLILNLIETQRYGSGTCQEIIHRLLKTEAALAHPEPEGTSLEWVEGAALSGEAVTDFDPEQFKMVTEEMATEAGVNLLFYTLIVETLVEEDRVIGIIIENKAGRQVILGQVFVDATGDGDLFASAGVPFILDRHPWGIDFGFRFGNVDVTKALDWRDHNPTQYSTLMSQVKTSIGNFHWETTNRLDTVCGDGGRIQGDGLNPMDLTLISIETRKNVSAVVHYLRGSMPGFENAYLIDTASQIGVRETRKVVGEYTLTREDVTGRKHFQDAIASSVFDIPYRCLVPKNINGLLVAGRCISVSHEAHGNIRNIPPCLATGQAAGVAAAISVQTGVSPRNINITALQKALKNQGVYLENK
jgi:hypothetical protein